MTLNSTSAKSADTSATGMRAAFAGRAAKTAVVAAAATAVMVSGAGAALAATPSAGHAGKSVGQATVTAAVGHTTAAAAVWQSVQRTGHAAATTSQTNCAASPHTCGYPDGTNTGVPATAQLRTVPGQVSSGPGWAYEKAGYVKVFGNGASLSNLYIPFNLDITASNVTINNVKVATSGTGSFGICLRHTSNVTIENSDIYAPASGDRLQYGIDDVYVDSVNTVIKSNQIHNTADGIQINEGDVTGNYIFNMKADSRDHVDGLLSTVGSDAANPLAVTDNTILNPVDQTSDVALYQDFGPQQNALISGNLLAGGGYSVYGGVSNGPATPTNIVITDNRFSPLYYPKSGNFGPAMYVSDGPGDVWSGNIWDTTLQSVPA